MYAENPKPLKLKDLINESMTPERLSLIESMSWPEGVGPHIEELVTALRKSWDDLALTQQTAQALSKQLEWENYNNWRQQSPNKRGIQGLRDVWATAMEYTAEYRRRHNCWKLDMLKIPQRIRRGDLDNAIITFWTNWLLGNVDRVTVDFWLPEIED